MRSLLIRFVSLLLFSTTTLAAQSSKVVNAPLLPESTSQQVEGGMWRLDGGFEATLRLKNVLLNRPLQARPSLVMANGTIVSLPAITLDPAGVATVNIGDAVKHLSGQGAASRSAYGMVVVDYQWSWAGAIMASVHNIDETAMLSFQSAVQSDMTAPDVKKQTDKQQCLEGVWWKPYANTGMFLFLGNASTIAKQITVELHSSTGATLAQTSVSLAPHVNTKLQPFTLIDTAPQPGTTGSIIVRATGSDRSLIAVAGLEDVSNGFSENLRLYEAHPERARNTAEHAITIATPGVMFGLPRTDMQFPANTIFTPYLVAHNASRAARIVSIAATYTQNGSPATLPLGTLKLAGGTTQTLDFAKLLAAAPKPDGNAVAITESFTGNESDIYSQIGSVDQTGNYVFEAESHIEDSTISRSICYWTVFSDTNTMISLWNYKSTAQDLVLTLFYRGGKYELPLHFAALAGQELDIATLMKQRTPDMRGNVLPMNITEGSALLSSVQGETAKMEIAVSSAYFNVRNGTCGQNCLTCNGVTSFQVSPNPGSLTMQNYLQMQGTATYNTGSSQSSTSGSWTSANPSIASVTSSGFVYGAAPGSSDISDYFGNAQIGVGYECFGYNLSCPTQNYQGDAPANVAPTLSLADALWFFGIGNYPPAEFTLGKTQSTITASGANGGSFVWTISSGADKVSFASGGTQQSSITTSSNSVSVYALGYSTSTNDVTVSLTWTPAQSSALTNTLSFGVDSPYRLVSTGPTQTGSAGPCRSPGGSSGWESYVPYRLLSFFGQRVTNIDINESFTSFADDYVGSAWAIPSQGYF